jgi:hypothetical protein
VTNRDDIFRALRKARERQSQRELAEAEHGQVQVPQILVGGAPSQALIVQDGPCFSASDDWRGRSSSSRRAST